MVLSEIRLATSSFAPTYAGFAPTCLSNPTFPLDAFLETVGEFAADALDDRGEEENWRHVPPAPATGESPA